MSPVSTVRRANAWIRDRAAVLAKFGVVGVVGIVVNLGVFNALRLGPLGIENAVGGSDDRVVTAKVIATVVSITFAWVAHRGWTFKNRRRHRPVKELILFGSVNALALVIEAGTVAVTHHGLGWTSLLADNVASLAGIALGTIARYVGFTTLVFSREPGPPRGRAKPSTNVTDDEFRHDEAAKR